MLGFVLLVIFASAFAQDAPHTGEVPHPPTEPPTLAPTLPPTLAPVPTPAPVPDRNCTDPIFDATCQDGNERDCARIKQAGHCSANWMIEYSFRYCKKTCRFCNNIPLTNIETDEECNAKLAKSQYKCEDARLATICPKSCCSEEVSPDAAADVIVMLRAEPAHNCTDPPIDPDCMDEDEVQCAEVEKAGDCTAQLDYSYRYCRKSCRFCNNIPLQNIAEDCVERFEESEYGCDDGRLAVMCPTFCCAEKGDEKEDGGEEFEDLVLREDEQPTKAPTPTPEPTPAPTVAPTPFPVPERNCTDPPVERECRDEVSSSYCRSLWKSGQCGDDNMLDYAYRYCRRSCNFCNNIPLKNIAGNEYCETTLDTDDYGCSDKRFAVVCPYTCCDSGVAAGDDVLELRALSDGKDPRPAPTLPPTLPPTEGPTPHNCTDPEIDPECADEVDTAYCEGVAKAGECTADFLMDYTYRYCRKSCKFCNNIPLTDIDLQCEERIASTRGECSNQRNQIACPKSCC